MLKTLRRIHDDEAGLEVFQAVCILAVAAIALAVIKIFWNDIKSWLAVTIAPIFSF